jgi:hypothetical protein
MNIDAVPRSPVALPRWIEAVAAVGAFLAVLVLLAVASSDSAQPAQAATHPTANPELRALQGHLQRSGTLSG